MGDPIFLDPTFLNYGATDVSIYHIPTNQWFVKGFPGDNLSQMGWGGDPSDKPVTMNLSSMD